MKITRLVYSKSPQTIRRFGKMLHVLQYLRYCKHYESPIIFIAGLPKSGTTWLSKMFNDLPGMRSTSPSYITQENHDLREDTFKEFSHELVALRLHLYWTPENGKILKYNHQKYVVMYRDLRDCAVSWYHYVTKVDQNHFLHDEVVKLNIEEGITFYIEHFLAREVQWIRDWRANRDHVLSTELRYEDLRKNTEDEFRRLCRFFGVGVEEKTLNLIVHKNSFSNAAQRAPGSENTASHQRKGIVGDWQNVFTSEHVTAFKEIAGTLLVDLGYESSLNWDPS